MVARNFLSAKKSELNCSSDDDGGSAASDILFARSNAPVAKVETLAAEWFLAQGGNIDAHKHAAS